MKNTSAHLLIVLNLLTAPFLSTALSGDPVGCLAASPGGRSEGMRSQRMRAENESCARMLKEEKLWQDRLDVSARVFLCDAVNAFAKPDGDVYLGQPLINQIIAKSGTAFAFQAGGFIMAHEYSHQFQFRILKDRGEEVTGGPALELQADLLAGYWVGMRLREQKEGLEAAGLYGEVEAISAIARKMAYDLGDFAVKSPQHHGTPQQRLKAASIGLSAGFGSKFGSPDEAFKENATKIYDWSSEQVAKIRESR